MFIGLNPWAIGVKAAGLNDIISAAQKGGFEGIEFNPSEIGAIIDAEGIAVARGKFADANLKPAGWGLSIDWRGTEEKWRSGLEELPALAKAAAAVGGTRCSTWIMPCSNDRNWDANWCFHVERFKPIAAILADHGVSLGLEFIGPKTLRDSQRYPFVHTLHAMIALGQAIGPNVGLLLDCWHWHTSGGRIGDLLSLKPEEVVYVHVNDAPNGVAFDDYVDNVRGLPGETGVIDTKGFLQSLKTIGYVGPVTAEPFKKELSDLPDDEARLAVVSKSMHDIFRHIR